MSGGRQRIRVRARMTGLTIIELLTAIVVSAILLTVAIPGLQSTMANASVRTESNRLLMDIQLARSEALKRGQFVNLCIADAQACDVEDPATCKCKVGVPSKRYDFGWLVYTAPNADADFDSGRDTLLFVGSAPSQQIEMRSNNIIQHRIGIKPGGLFAGSTGDGEVGVCFNGESTEGTAGRMLVVHLTGRTDIKTIPPGQSCDPAPPGGGPPGGGPPGGGPPDD